MKQFIRLPEITGKQPKVRETTWQISTPFQLLIKISDATNDEIKSNSLNFSWWLQLAKYQAEQWQRLHYRMAYTARLELR